jgi:hypothetical protein
MSKFEVNRREFNMGLKDTRTFKEFVNSVPDTASYRLDPRDEGIFLHAYWIAVNETEEVTPVVDNFYTIELPPVCIYGKSAYDMIISIKAHDGIPFVLNATDTIDLSRGYLDILFKKIKSYQAPYVIVKGWVKEHIQLLEEVNSNYKLVIRLVENDAV